MRPCSNKKKYYVNPRATTVDPNSKMPLYFRDHCGKGSEGRAERKTSAIAPLHRLYIRSFHSRTGGWRGFHGHPCASPRVLDVTQNLVVPVRTSRSFQRVCSVRHVNALSCPCYVHVFATCSPRFG